MKFTNVFRDVLKGEDWDNNKKSWFYPLLKTKLVNIKSLESGGATIPTSKYSVDNTAGIIQWNGEGQPTDITLVADCPNAFLGMLRKYLLYSVGSFILIGGLMFWLGSIFNPPPVTENLGTTALIIDSLSKTIDSLSTTITSLKSMPQGSDTTGVTGFRNMITDLQRQQATLVVAKDSIVKAYKTSITAHQQEKNNYTARKNRLQSQLNSRNSELAACKNNTNNTSRGQYSGYKATYLCRKNSTKFPKIVQAGVILKGVGISLKYSTFDSPTSDVKKIIYKKNDKAFAEYVLKRIKNLGIVASIEEENGSNIPDKTVFICID